MGCVGHRDIAPTSENHMGRKIKHEIESHMMLGYAVEGLGEFATITARLGGPLQLSLHAPFSQLFETLHLKFPTQWSPPFFRI